MTTKEEYMGKVSKVKMALETIIEVFTTKGELHPIIAQSIGDIVDELKCGICLGITLENVCFFCPMYAICSVIKLRKTDV